MISWIMPLHLSSSTKFMENYSSSITYKIRRKEIKNHLSCYTIHLRFIVRNQVIKIDIEQTQSSRSKLPKWLVKNGLLLNFFCKQTITKTCRMNNKNHSTQEKRTLKNCKQTTDNSVKPAKGYCLHKLVNCTGQKEDQDYSNKQYSNKGNYRNIFLWNMPGQVSGRKAGKLHCSHNSKN